MIASLEMLKRPLLEQVLTLMLHLSTRKLNWQKVYLLGLIARKCSLLDTFYSYA